MYKRYINNKNPQTRQAFTQATNLYFSTVKTKKQKYYNLKFNNCIKDIKSTWKLINSIIGKNINLIAEASILMEKLFMIL